MYPSKYMLPQFPCHSFLFIISWHVHIFTGAKSRLWRVQRGNYEAESRQSNDRFLMLVTAEEQIRPCRLTPPWFSTAASPACFSSEGNSVRKAAKHTGGRTCLKLRKISPPCRFPLKNRTIVDYLKEFEYFFFLSACRLLFGGSHRCGFPSQPSLMPRTRVAAQTPLVYEE